MIDTDKYEGHTEGPWEWDDLHSTGEEKLFVHKKGDDNNLIAEVSGKINGKSECANAQLIADAPLLLAEVKRLRMYEVAWKILYDNAKEEERETRTRTWKVIMELVSCDVREMVDTGDAVFGEWAKRTNRWF